MYGLLKGFFMFKRILSVILIFITVFNLSVYTYKSTEVKGADIVVVGGTTIAVDTLIKWVVGMCATLGVASYVKDNPQKIRENAVDMATSYYNFLEAKSDSQVLASQYSADMLKKTWSNVQSNVDMGITKGISISNDIYNSFKSFLNDYISSESPDISFDTDLLWDKKNDYVLNDYNLYGLKEAAYVSIDDNYQFFYDNYSNQKYRCNNHSGSYYDVFVPFVYGKTEVSTGRLVYNVRTMSVCGFCGNWLLGFDEKKIGYNIGSTNMPIFINPTSSRDDIGFNLAKGLVRPIEKIVPSWKQGLIDNNDIIDFGSRAHITDNYDVIYPNYTYVDDDVIVGQRAFDLPNVGSYQDLLQQYLDKKITYEEFINALQKLIGVGAIDDPNVILRENDIVIPKDTPIIGGIGVDIVDDIVVDVPIEEIIEEGSASAKSVNGFPDLTQIFPFCIPFDVVRLLNLLRSSPTAPYFEIPIEIPWFNVSYTMVVDFVQFEMLSRITRTFLSIIWVVFLILSTRKLIKA